MRVGSRGHSRQGVDFKKALTVEHSMGEDRKVKTRTMEFGFYHTDTWSCSTYT